MKNYQSHVITKNSTIIAACHAITKNKSRCVLIEDKKKIIGILSEGDLLRAFLSGADLNSRVTDYINLSFIFFKKKDLDKAKLIFKKKKITLIPILNNYMKLIDLITVNEILDKIK
jgi:predicted transcriptional regulator